MTTLKSDICARADRIFGKEEIHLLRITEAVAALCEELHKNGDTAIEIGIALNQTAASLVTLTKPPNETRKFMDYVRRSAQVTITAIDQHH